MLVLPSSCRVASTVPAEEACDNTLTETTDCTSPEPLFNHEDGHRTCGGADRQPRERDAGQLRHLAETTPCLRAKDSYRMEVQYFCAMDGIAFLRYIRGVQSLHNRGDSEQWHITRVYLALPRRPSTLRYTRTPCGDGRPRDYSKPIVSAHGATDASLATSLSDS